MTRDSDVRLSDGTTLREVADPDPRHPRIGRRIYSDPEIFELECDRIFRRAWCFLGHESEIPEPGDYVGRELAREPVILIRGEDGVVRAFLNSCRHRGMRVCRADRGRGHMRCPYHGWTYNSNGELVKAFAEQLYEPSRLVKSELGLIPVAQLESYHGMIFATWDEDAAPLREFLGDMAWYLDTLVGRTANGSEVIGVPQIWQMETNWKFSVDNFTGDPYHLSTAHHSIALLGLAPRDPMSGHEGHTINAGHGHQLLIKPALEDESTQYYGLPQEVRNEMARDADEVRREFMKNSYFNVGTLFPNLSWLQIEIQGDPDTPPTAFLNFRQWQPASPTRTAVWSWLFMDKCAPEDFRKNSYKTYVRTFGPSGIYEQDDAEIWEECTRVNLGKVAQRHSLHHGMGLHMPPDPTFPGPGTAYEGTFNEITQLAYYEEWLRWLTTPPSWSR